MTEQELVAAARRGDKNAFGQLVADNQAMVYSLAYRMTGHADDAEDLAQEAFLNAWRGLDKFRGQSSFSTWLYRLTSNACVDFLRKKKRRGELSMTLEEDGEEEKQADIADERWSPQEEVERQETREAVRQGLAALSPDHREVLLLRELEGLSYREIGQRLGLEEGTVKSRIARGRLALRDHLIKSGNFSPPPSSKG